MSSTHQNNWCSTLVRRAIFQYLSWDQKLEWMKDAYLNFQDSQADQQVKEWINYRRDLTNLIKISQHPAILGHNGLSVLNPYSRINYQGQIQEDVHNPDYLYLHTLKDIHQSDYFRPIPQTELEFLPLKQYLLPSNSHIDNGKQIRFTIPKYLPVLSQIQIVASSLDKLEAIIYNLSRIELENSGQIIERSPGKILQLDWELFKQTYRKQSETDLYVYPICQNFCQPHRPHLIGLSPWQGMYLTIELLPEIELYKHISCWSNLNLNPTQIFQAEYQPLDLVTRSPLHR